MNQTTQPNEPGGVTYWRTLARQRDGELQRLRDQLIQACDEAENDIAAAGHETRRGEAIHADQGFDILDELLMKLRQLATGGGQS